MVCFVALINMYLFEYTGQQLAVPAFASQNNASAISTVFIPDNAFDFTNVSKRRINYAQQICLIKIQAW